MTEVILPPAYADGSTYCYAPAGHHHHHPYAVAPTPAPAPPPTDGAIGGVRALPGVYLEHPFAEPYEFPPTSGWSALDPTNDATDEAVVQACLTAATALSFAPIDAATPFETAPVLACLRADVRLLRYPVPGSHRYVFVEKVGVSGTEPAAVVYSGQLAFDALFVGSMLGTAQLAGGFFDDLTTKSERAWGYTAIHGGTRLPLPLRQLFAGPDVCFVVGGDGHRQLAPRTVRVIGTPKTGTLDVDIVGLVAGDDDTPLVTGKVGRDLEVHTHTPPFVVRVRRVPVDAGYAFQGVSVVLASCC